MIPRCLPSFWTHPSNAISTTRSYTLKMTKTPLNGIINKRKKRISQ